MIELAFIQEFGILFLIIVGVSFLVKLIRQPIIIGYVIAGLIFSLILAENNTTGSQVIILAELGITFLLFLMGLEFDFKSLKYLGKDILIVTAIQSAIYFVIIFVISTLFKFSITETIYLTLLFMFSSTLLVAKWIEDKKETDTLHGKMVLGILIMQDLFAIIAMTFLSVMNEKSVVKILLAPVEGIVLLLIAFIFAKYILNRLFRIASRYPELLFIFSLGICFVFVEIAPLLGYSSTIGAFLAGVTIANTIYKDDVSSRLKPLIIFFNMLFFVGLGFQIKFDMESSMILFIALLGVLSLVLKPIVSYLTLKMRGYDPKTSFISGLYLAQFSEFGMIIILIGVSSGAIGNHLLSTSIILIVVSMIISSYLIKYSKEIYLKFEKHLLKIDGIFPKKKIEGSVEVIDDYNILFFGYYELNKELISKLKTVGKKILVIEDDPANIALLKLEGLNYAYNSISNPEFFGCIKFDKVELVISNLVDVDENKMIIKHLKQSNPKATAIVTARSLKDSLELYDHDADYVIYLSHLNDQQVSVLLEDYTTDINHVIDKKIRDIAKLKEIEQKRKEVSLDNDLILDINTFIDNLSKKNNKHHSTKK